MRCGLCRKQMEIKSQEGNVIIYKCVGCGYEITLKTLKDVSIDDKNYLDTPRDGADTDKMVDEGIID